MLRKLPGRISTNPAGGKADMSSISSTTSEAVNEILELDWTVLTSPGVNVEVLTDRASAAGVPPTLTLPLMVKGPGAENMRMVE